MIKRHRFRFRFLVFGLVLLLAFGILSAVGFNGAEVASAIGLETTPAPPDLAPVVQDVLPSVVLDGPFITPQLKVGEKSSLELSVAGKMLPGCFGAPLKPVDAVVVIDTSPSAGRPVEGSNLWQSEQILKSLWAQMDQPVCTSPAPENCQSSRLSIITMDIGTTDVEINTRLPLTSTADTIATTIEGLDTGADSSFDLGIKQASKLLDKEGRAGAEKIIVLLLHDNFFTSVETVINQARQAGGKYPLYVIGDTLNLREEEKITKEEAEQLTSASNIYIDPSAVDLRRMFVKSSGGDENIAGRSVSIGSLITPVDGVNLWSDDGKINQGRISWQLPEIQAGDTHDFQADIKVQDDLNATTLAIAGELSYLDCNGRIAVGVHQEKQFSVGEEKQAQETPKPTDTVPPPTPTRDIPGNDNTAEEGGHGGGGGGRTPPRIPWKIVLPVLLVIPILLYFILCRAQVLPWCRSDHSPTPVAPTGVRIEEKTEKNGWKPPVHDEGVDITPGQKKDNEALRHKLMSASSISGRIPTHQRGQRHSPVSVEVLSSANEFKKSSFDLKKMAHYAKGDQKFDYFVWSSSDGEIEVPIDLLQEVILKRISSETPLIVFWTPHPTDNSEFRITISPSSHGITVAGQRKYRPQAQGANPQQSFFVSMKFINNKQHLRIAKGPIIDN